MPAVAADGVSEPARLAQAVQPQAQAAPAAPGASADAQAPEEPIGNVATVVGNATVTRNDAAIPLKVKDEIYLNDLVQTSAKSSLGITFNDATTFNLTANARITIDTFVYEDGGKNNAALFEVVKGTVAFVAASVAKTGDMKISTPTATLGIRGTSGVVEVPEDASATGRNNVAVKLYPDADGKVGRIEVDDRAGLRLGFLSQGASGFTIRAGAGGARFAAVPLTISPQQILRDQGFVRQVHSTQNLGRRVVNEHRAFRRANPGVVNPNRPNRSGQPGGLRPNGPQRQNNLQNRPGQQQQPGLPNRQGLNRQGLPQRAGSPAQPGVTGRSGLPPRPNLQQPNVQPQPGIRQGVPGPLRPGLQNRPALQRRPAAPARRLPREIR
ncbi:MAG: FecR domain-containing protein [Bradyrhizobium sp.]|nr:FecR domain-containing protein [Bradyrhizobium sp.]MDO9298017.1 FecR domain-containing protein [Bradyrhizobium sp.]